MGRQAPRGLRSVSHHGCLRTIVHARMSKPKQPHPQPGPQFSHTEIHKGKGGIEAKKRRARIGESGSGQPSGLCLIGPKKAVLFYFFGPCQWCQSTCWAPWSERDPSGRKWQNGCEKCAPGPQRQGQDNHNRLGQKRARRARRGDSGSNGKN